LSCSCRVTMLSSMVVSRILALSSENPHSFRLPMLKNT
jgi:hypothetical protein